MNLQKLIAGVLLLTLLTGCGAAKAPAPTETQSRTEAPAETQAELPTVPASEDTLWIPEGTELRMAQTRHSPELAEVIAETYGISQEEWQNTRCYYDYVDLNEDGVDEILAVVMGMYTSGSGGGSEPAFVRLTCTDGIYTNPADAEVLESLEGITGTAILCNDAAADLAADSALTLAGSR